MGASSEAMRNGGGVPNIIRVRSFFVYSPTVFTLAPAAAPISIPVRIDSASDFFWIKACFMADIAGASSLDGTRILPNWDVQLQQGGADKNLFSAPQPLTNVFGTGQLPFVLPFPQKLVRNSELTVTCSTREVAVTLNVRLSFIGWKDYGELRTG